MRPYLQARPKSSFFKALFEASFSMVLFIKEQQRGVFT